MSSPHGAEGRAKQAPAESKRTGRRKQRSKSMDVLAQVRNVVEQAEQATGKIALTLDMDDPGQRAAYAAAIAVLGAMGADPLAFTSPAVAAPESSVVAPEQPPERVSPDDAPEAAGDDERDAQLRQRFAESIAELTTDEARRATIVKETFPRIREILRDGANVEAVAQIQYRRWVEEHLDAVR